ncbi:MAG: DNA-3-methyladenine glycosylase [Gemmatimonadota bacterium]|nr:MAG: DNA-3-methyladenine glycosylase [Gemmatimonadota bacterium]
MTHSLESRIEIAGRPNPRAPAPDQLEELAKRDPLLGTAMKRMPPFPKMPPTHLRGSHFHAIARSIVYQQLATAAARTIYGRVRDLTARKGFPTAEQLLDLPEKSLRGAGLSRAKTKAILDLSTKVAAGELRLGGLGRLDDDEIVRRLTTIWGVGEWTAHMFLIFKLGRLDVMPAKDLGVQEGMRRLDGMVERPGPDELLSRAEVWRPLRSVAAWVLWRLTD